MRRVCVCRVQGVHDMLRAFSAHSSSQRTHGREKRHKLLTACFWTCGWAGYRLTTSARKDCAMALVMRDGQTGDAMIG